ncbi:MAG: hypothetical protein DLM54_01420 [Acidimicrobiales bacterium]|nr:MAG: hypothetical protein DLM54_01420 [Acidimicrobiales bacterium]
MALILAFPASQAWASEAPGAGSPTNTASAVNTRDASSVFRIAFALQQINGGVVNPTNTATAYASCTSCQTVAIGVQVVLASGSPSVYTPTNTATAVNYKCTMCDTVALAYQFVVQTPVPERLSPQGNRELAQIEASLQRLRSSGLTGPQLKTQVAALMSQLNQTLATDLVPINPSQRGGRGGSRQERSVGAMGDNTPTSSSTTNVMMT